MTRFRGGGQIGRVQSSWPFVTFEVLDHEIRLNTVVQEVTIARDQIVQIRCQRGLLVSKVIVEHRAPAIKENVQFWTFSPDAVMNVVRGKGYPAS